MFKFNIGDKDLEDMQISLRLRIDVKSKAVGVGVGVKISVGLMLNVRISNFESSLRPRTTRITDGKLQYHGKK